MLAKLYHTLLELICNPFLQVKQKGGGGVGGGEGGLLKLLVMKFTVNRCCNK